MEVAPLVPCFPRTRSWPDIHRPVVELNVEDLDCGGGVSDKQEMPKKVDLKDSVPWLDNGKKDLLVVVLVEKHHENNNEVLVN